MSVTFNKLKDLENRGNAPLKARSTYLLINELLENLTKEERDFVEKEFLEELSQKRRLQLKVTCPRCKMSVSRRLGFKNKSKSSDIQSNAIRRPPQQDNQ